jgi:hypothetical protein
MCPRPDAEPTEPAAEIDDREIAKVWQHGPQNGPLGRTIETLSRAAEAAVACEEFRVIVDVLGHSMELGVLEWKMKVSSVIPGKP